MSAIDKRIMERETINRIEVLDTGVLFLGIEGQGKSMYQHVYREAAGVYWDSVRHGFQSTPMRDKTCSQWYKQIIVAAHYIGVELTLAGDIKWSGVSEHEKMEIQRAKAI